MSPDQRGKALDLVLDNATPVLEFAKSALDLVLLAGLTLVAKALLVLLDGVKGRCSCDSTQNAFMNEIKALDDTLMKMLKQTRAAVDVQILQSTIEELGKRTKDSKGGCRVFGFCKGVIYSSQNEAMFSDMKDELVSAIQTFKNVLSGVIQDVKKIRQELKEAGIAGGRREDEENEKIPWCRMWCRNVQVLLSSDLENPPVPVGEKKEWGKNMNVGMNTGEEHCAVCGIKRRLQVIAMVPN
ncbi:hypothetical protein B0H14DRAFT_2606760 [Mycena olivaceomarginata]|nr:hypothetical protein B0H14DRAFT_2606760 [Mycena olivaceomarginata]